MQKTFVTVFTMLCLAACSDRSGSAIDATSSDVQTGNSEQIADYCGASGKPEDRRLLFGETHLHTSLSYDANLQGYQTTPDQAYRFAKGETIDYLGQAINREVPLDFALVTDHVEWLGVLNEMRDVKSRMALSELGQKLLREPENIGVILRELRGSGAPLPPEAFAAVSSVWSSLVDTTHAHYEPCKFTTFIGYEWTAMAQGLYNLHRNIIWESDSAPFPFGANNSRRPEDLWTYLETARKNGFDSIAITHNGNASNGLMYDLVDSDGDPIDADYARRRSLNEPLAEIAQTKGQSETIPALSPTDEFADFEIFGRLLVDPVEGNPNGSFVRQALVRGIDIEAQTGVNPYDFGIVGGTDFHNGLSTQKETSFGGNAEGTDPDVIPPNIELARKIALRETIVQAGNVARDPRINSGGTLTGVWADANDRKSLFAALKRKETFATSGPRMRIRFFGGWNFDSTLLDDSDWLGRAYKEGVPMGGILPDRQEGLGAPRFIIQAARDPEDANLDRIQVIKQTVSADGYVESIFDVALSNEGRRNADTGKVAPVGNTVDEAAATYSNTIGVTQLQTVWADPEFDPDVAAVYYVRALQIPTPRWTTILAVRAGLAPDLSGHATIQERGWSSPIWYRPEDK